ncbi:MAG: hypothetical protein JWP87_1092 [Labilithrix sp.]|nr:hypothetical protein [Labilithrix sp.]
MTQSPFFLLSRSTIAFVASVASVAMALALTASCGTPTSTTQIWRAPVAAPAITRVLVFGTGMSETGRRVTEDQFVDSLTKRGIAAKQSYELFPQLPEKETARQMAASAGFDGALVAKLRSVQETNEYVPSIGGPFFWDAYYGDMGTVVTEKRVKVETTLWDLRKGNGTLVWSATTETDNPSSGEDAAKSLTKELVPKLADSGLLAPARK